MAVVTKRPVRTNVLLEFAAAKLHIKLSSAKYKLLFNRLTVLLHRQ